jgi:Tol biopolymer transport system component/outer membrane protein assembly factor BamD (BamD/ComL family)
MVHIGGEQFLFTKKLEVKMSCITTIALCMAIGLILGNYQAFAQTAEEFLAQGMQLEEVKGELDRAIEIYQTIIVKFPDNRLIAAKALLHIGLCSEKLGLKQAQQTFQDVINKYPEQKDEVALAKERVVYLNAFVADISKMAEQHLKKGNELFNQWEYESAIEAYKNAIKVDPNNPLALNARYYIGQSWFKAGQYDTALATFKKLIEEFPESNITPVTELMVVQVEHAMKNNKNPGMANDYSDENEIVDPETGITYRKIKTLTGASDIITYTTDLNLSSNGKFLLFGNMVVPMDGTAPFELIEFKSTGIKATRGTWSPDGKQAAFYSGDALCVVPISPETGHTTGPLIKINKVELKWQSNPGWSPDGKKLTYYGPGGDIWTIDADGSDLRQISNSDDREIGPAWSPDGKTIAYGIGNMGIGLYNIEKVKSSEFVEVGSRCFPVWSPDGKWIMQNWQKLHFYNLNDKSEFEFSTPQEAGDFFSWSPEGKKMLFFHTSYHGASGLKIASSTGGPSFEPVPRLINWGTAGWSGNSKLMAVQGEDEKGEIAFRIVPLTGGESFLINLDNLTNGKPFPFGISTNLKKLLFEIDRNDGKKDLYVVPISAEEARATGPAVKIFDGWYREGAFNIITSLSPDGEKVALIHEGDIWIAYTNGDNPIPVKNIPDRGGYIRWAPDGKVLLFDTSSGWSLLENPGPQGKIIRLLDEGKEIECRHWNIDISPDKSRFAVLSDEQIRIIPLDNSKSNQILNFRELKLSQCSELNWSPDGENLAFIGMKKTKTDDPVLYAEGKYQIYNIPVNGGQPIRVASDDDGYKWALSWSPDGKWISYSPEEPVKVRPESTMWEANFNEIKEKLLK